MSEIVEGHGADLDKTGSDMPPAATGMLARALMQAGEGARKALEVEDSAAAVHELRKSFKRLRGLLRLVRGRQMRPARELRRTIADAARQL
ncbi:MAG TPA: CHAD domain-containing protein, partial [Ancylobacter sp.]